LIGGQRIDLLQAHNGHIITLVGQFFLEQFEVDLATAEQRFLDAGRNRH
jgi:hypothetical protein